MPQHIALHGVIIPVLAGLALIAVQLFAQWLLLRRASLRVGSTHAPLWAWLFNRFDGTKALNPALVLVFILSFHARQGLQWPPPTAWEWFAPALVATTLAVWLHPAPSIALIASIATAWALALPGMKDPPWRIAIGACVLILTAVLLIMWAGWGRGISQREDRAARAGRLLALSAAFAGLAGVIIASGFEKLTTIMAALALFLFAAAVFAWFHRNLAIGAGVIPACMVLVGAAAIARAYGSDDFPFWHWPVAVCAPMAAMVAEFPLRAWRDRPNLRAITGVAAVALVAFANAGAALAPLIARGEFPPK